MNTPTLTPDEAALVRDLLKLYEHVLELYEHALEERYKHPSQCECPLCAAHERAGEHKAVTFSSLTAKVYTKP